VGNHEVNLQQLRKQSFENELGTGRSACSKHEVSLQQLRKQSFENELGTGGWSHGNYEVSLQHLGCANKVLGMSLEQVGGRFHRLSKRSFEKVITVVFGNLPPSYPPIKTP
jgi:hypothetical protein